MIATEMITDYDRYLFHEGTHSRMYRCLGAHPTVQNGTRGTFFAVYAPAAKSVSVLTERYGWDGEKGRMTSSSDGIWSVFLPGVRAGDRYRYAVEGGDGITRFKADPYGFSSEMRPSNASVVCSLRTFHWTDAAFCASHDAKSAPDKPMAIYEVHLGSWKKDYANGWDGFLNYRTLADQLAEYVGYMGFTHVELIGICEHPFDGSWGYQVTGFFAPTSRYGTPDDFRYFVDTMHRCGIGVILDWVPAHFPKDDFGLERFDGTPLYESADPLQAEYPEWGTKAFDHGKPEVRSFLISSALYWIKEFHIDALRVDAVAAMLYSSFGRQEWRPNCYGGPEDLDGIAFLKQLNETVRKKSRAFLIAEDSSIMEGITKPVSKGGVGFLMKWNMGWMNDTLKYIAKDPIYRKWHHGSLTYVSEYAFLEQYVLVLSHDEVVHLKHSMLEKFPGSLQDKLGGLKTLYAYQMTFPGKKLLFMGQEFAEDREWDENRAINWSLADDPGHRDVMETLRRLLSLYRRYPCLYSDTGNPNTFEWVNKDDAPRNTISYIRRNPWNYNGALLVIGNFAPMEYGQYACGVPGAGSYRRVFSTLQGLYGEGEDVRFAEAAACDGRSHRITFNLRPYETVIYEIPDFNGAK